MSSIKDLKPPNAINKLRKLEFDPIEESIKTYQQTNDAIDRLLGQSKYSPIALASLLSIKQKTANDLIRYKYARTNENVLSDASEYTPIRIILTS
jgi:hypothetical protein